jgi:hypothetical protein
MVFEGLMEEYASRSPAPLDCPFGHLQEVSGLDLGEAMIPEKIKDLTLLQGKLFYLAVKLGPQREPSGLK